MQQKGSDLLHQRLRWSACWWEGDPCYYWHMLYNIKVMSHIVIDMNVTGIDHDRFFFKLHKLVAAQLNLPGARATLSKRVNRSAKTAMGSWWPRHREKKLPSEGFKNGYQVVQLHLYHVSTNYKQTDSCSCGYRDINFSSHGKSQICSVYGISSTVTVKNYIVTFSRSSESLFSLKC